MSLGNFTYGAQNHIVNGTSNQSISTSGAMVGMRFYAPKTGNISTVGFRTGTVTSSQSLTISLQDDNATSGAPDGVQDQTGTQSSVATGTSYTVTLGSSRAVTRGDIIWAVVEFTSTTGNLIIVSTSVGATTHAPAATSLKSAGTWTNQNKLPIVWIGYDDGLYYPINGIVPGSVTFQQWTNASGNISRGMRFKVPHVMEVQGIQWMGSIVGDTVLSLYDDDGTTVLATTSMDKDTWGASTQINNVIFATPVVCRPDKVYRAVLIPQAASNTTFFSTTCLSNAVLGNTVGGIEWQQTTGTSGSWAETNTIRPNFALILSNVPQAAARVNGGLAR